jgi:hypothetical protein
MATEKSEPTWIVRFKPFASQASQTGHMSSIKALTADTGNPFDVKIDRQFSLPEVSGYIASFDEATKAQLEALPNVSGPFFTFSVLTYVPRTAYRLTLTPLGLRD